MGEITKLTCGCELNKQGRVTRLCPVGLELSREADVRDGIADLSKGEAKVERRREAQRALELYLSHLGIGAQGR